MFTRKDWQADKKKLGDALQSPKNKKTNVGPNLDKYHKKGAKLEARDSALDLVAAGPREYFKVNDDAAVKKVITRREREVVVAGNGLDKFNAWMDKKTFQDAWKDRGFKTEFLKFAKKEHNDENVRFLMAVEGSDKPLSIYSNFVSDDGKDQVNLSAPVRKKLDNLADRGLLSNKRVFQAASTEVTNMLDRDVFPRFKRTDAWPEWCANNAPVKIS